MENKKRMTAKELIELTSHDWKSEEPMLLVCKDKLELANTVEILKNQTHKHLSDAIFTYQKILALKSMTGSEINDNDIQPANATLEKFYETVLDNANFLLQEIFKDSEQKWNKTQIFKNEKI